MTPRYGILVQSAQLLAQLFIDWCIQRDRLDKTFTFTVPPECVAGLEPEYSGVLVTITPIKSEKPPT